jgi:Fe-S-cluster containining protein
MSNDVEKPRLPPGSPCTNCGKCCTNPSFMENLTATEKDVRRWRREGRDDILKFVDVLGRAGKLLPGGDYADLWVDPETGDERSRCPFVRKVRGQPRYLCTIYETRPQVCRDYEPWSGKDNDVCEIVEP